jgi:hypothetical protein
MASLGVLSFFAVFVGVVAGQLSVTTIHVGTRHSASSEHQGTVFIPRERELKFRWRLESDDGAQRGKSQLAYQVRTVYETSLLLFVTMMSPS